MPFGGSRVRLDKPIARTVAVLTVLAALGWHVHARSRPDAELGAADRLLLSVTGPIQDAIEGVADGAGGFSQRYFDLVGVGEENAQLRAEILAARAALAELDELRAQNDRLRGLVGLSERAEGRVLAASVIGRGTSPRFHTVRIDRGSREGVEAGMAVVVPQGAVGQVLRVSAHYSDVLLLSDGLSAAGAVVQRTRLRGVVAGTGGDELSLAFVRRRDHADVQPGDLLVGSGEDGVFPMGVALGTVLAVAVPDTGLFLDVTVEPTVGIERLDEVLVVLDAGTGPFVPGEPEDGSLAEDADAPVDEAPDGSLAEDADAPVDEAPDGALAEAPREADQIAQGVAP